MKEYKNELTTDFMFWEVKNICRDFDGYCESMGLEFVKENVTEHKLTGGMFCYVETANECGIVMWWGLPDEAESYILPDEIEIDMENGIISSENEFTVYKITNWN